MNTKVKSFLGLMIIGFTFMVIFAYSYSRPIQTTQASPEVSEVVIDQDFSYVYLDEEQAIDHADAIFLGQVVNVSPTRWNQDSGRAWNQGLQIHTVAVEVIEAIVDEVDLDKRATITVLGESPLAGGADHNLSVGERAIFFIRQTDLAWREGGTRPILEFISAPTDSYYRQRGDGLFDGRPGTPPISLEEVTGQISQRRPTISDGDGTGN